MRIRSLLYTALQVSLCVNLSIYKCICKAPLMALMKKTNLMADNFCAEIFNLFKICVIYKCLKCLRQLFSGHYLESSFKLNLRSEFKSGPTNI